MATPKHKALKSKTTQSHLPHVSMGGKYQGGMEFMRHHAKGTANASYIGTKKTRKYIEKQPSSFAKSVRRHVEK